MFRRGDGGDSLPSDVPKDGKKEEGNQVDYEDADDDVQQPRVQCRNEEVCSRHSKASYGTTKGSAVLTSPNRRACQCRTACSTQHKPVILSAGSQVAFCA